MKLNHCRYPLILASIILFLGLPGFAQYDEMDFDELLTPYERNYNGQTYTQFPPQMTVPPAAPPEPRPWYKKIFSPFMRHASPPINQVPKIPKERPRETIASSDPLVRLARGVSYQDKTVAPGLYLLNLVPENDDRGPSLRLFRQQQHVLEVPATALSPNKATRLQPDVTNSSLPEPPDKSGQTGRSPKLPEALATVEISHNGETLILVYQLGDRQYASVPLNITGPMQY